MRLRIAFITTALALAPLLAACAASGGSASDDDALRVVATTTQVGSLAAEIGGEAIELTVLLGPGVEAHDFELTPAHGAALEEADVVLLSGAGLEDWLTETLATIGVEDRARDMSEGVDLREAPEDEHAEDEHAEDEHAGDEHAEDEHAEDEHEHAGGVDPHYWLSGPNAILMAGNVRDALAEAAPGQAEAFEERASAVIERLEEADAEVRRLIGEVPEDERKLVTDHDALGYFVEEYGLTFVGSVFPSLDVASEPSAREVEALVAEIREQGVRAIFTESAVNPTLAQAVAAETDATLVEEPLYTDSLGPAGSGADTVAGMLVHNARVIRDGLLGD